MPRKSKKAMAQELFLEAYARCGSITRAFDLVREAGEYGRRDLPPGQPAEDDPDKLQMAELIRSLPLHRQRHYEWVQADPDYRDRFFAADETATQVLEGEAYRRAYEGVQDFKLDREGAQHPFLRFSDTLLIFLLKARRPEKYRERFDHRLSGSSGGPIGVDVNRPDTTEGTDADDDFYDDAWDAIVASGELTPAGDQGPDEAGPSEPVYT